MRSVAWLDVGEDEGGVDLARLGVAQAGQGDQTRQQLGSQAELRTVEQNLAITHHRVPSISIFRAMLVEQRKNQPNQEEEFHFVCKWKKKNVSV